MCTVPTGQSGTESQVMQGLWGWERKYVNLKIEIIHSKLVEISEIYALWSTYKALD